jgi:hypothetical protein
MIIMIATRQERDAATLPDIPTVLCQGIRTSRLMLAPVADLVKQAALAQMQQMSQPAHTQQLAQPSAPMRPYGYPVQVCAFANHPLELQNSALLHSFDLPSGGPAGWPHLACFLDDHKRDESLRLRDTM